MLENCADIYQCETILSNEVSKVRLLGQIDYSANDLEKLSSLIKINISVDPHQGTEHLKNVAPCCFACFLVWEGISKYREGDYWSVIRDAVGFSDPNWQSRWGRIFIEFLKDKGRPLFDIPGTHRYLTPILAHGGIPDYCLKDFFAKVLMPLFRKLENPNDRGEILQEISLYRKEESEKNKIEAQINELKELKSEDERKSGHLRALITLSERLRQFQELEQKAGDISEIDGLPSNPREYILIRLKEVNQKREMLKNAVRIKDACISLHKVQEHICTFAQQVTDQVQNSRQALEILTSKFKEEVDSIASIMQEELAASMAGNSGSRDALRTLILIIVR